MIASIGFLDPDEPNPKFMWSNTVCESEDPTEDERFHECDSVTYWREEHEEALLIYALLLDFALENDFRGAMVKLQDKRTLVHLGVMVYRNG